MQDMLAIAAFRRRHLLRCEKILAPEIRPEDGSHGRANGGWFIAAAHHAADPADQLSERGTDGRW